MKNSKWLMVMFGGAVLVGLFTGFVLDNLVLNMLHIINTSIIGVGFMIVDTIEKNNAK